MFGNREQAVDELKGITASDADRKKVLDILQRFHDQAGMDSRALHAGVFPNELVDRIWTKCRVASGDEKDGEDEDDDGEQGEDGEEEGSMLLSEQTLLAIVSKVSNLSINLQSLGIVAQNHYLASPSDSAKSCCFWRDSGPEPGGLV